MVTLKIAVILMGIFSYTSVANGKCCAGCPLSGECPDGTGCTPLFSCCATGSCNLGCCNCGGECRQSSVINRFLSRADIQEKNLDIATQRFDQLDADNNGAVDYQEFRRFPRSAWGAAFQEIDANHDGKITIEEFDEDAGQSLEKLQ